MKLPHSSLLTLLSVCLPLLTAAHAGPAEPKTVVPPVSPFDAGGREVQIGAGAFFSLNNRGEKRPKLNDVDLSARLGWMLYDASGPGCLRGNCELLGELFGAAVVEGPGDVLGGAALLFRYNFIQPEARWVPYLDLGAGGLFNDIHKEYPQRIIGRAFEFKLQGALGLRYLWSSRCALFIEADFRHISNANTADRNLGLNSVGGLIGGSFFF